MRDVFDHLDRNKDHHLDRRELLSPTASLAGHLKGDRNHDHKLNFNEFAKEMKESKLSRVAGAGARPNPDQFPEYHKAFTMKDHHATFRTHPRGLTLGLLQPGDTFIASAVKTEGKAEWLFGYVKGHPERSGWVLRSSLPKEHHDPTTPERAAGPKPTYKQDGLEYYTGHDRVLLKHFQHGEHIPDKEKLGYTTPVSVKNPLSSPVNPLDGLKAPPRNTIDIYANFPCTPENKLKIDGHALQIPFNEKVRFRYTPDGKSAVVFLSPELLDKMGVHRGSHNGIWAIVKMDDLEIPPGTMGAQTPAHRLSPVAV